MKIKFIRTPFIQILENFRSINAKTTKAIAEATKIDKLITEEKVKFILITIPMIKGITILINGFLRRLVINMSYIA